MYFIFVFVLPLSYKNLNTIYMLFLRLSPLGVSVESIYTNTQRPVSDRALR